MKLYELSAAWVELQEMDCDPQTLADTLEAIEGELDEKLVNISKLVRSLNAEAEAVQFEILRLRTQKERLEKKVDGLMEYARNAMLMTHKTNVSDGISGFRIQKNPPKVEILSDEAIPLCYYTEKVVRTVDKNAIKQAIQGGFTVPGAVLKQDEAIRLK